MTMITPGHDGRQQAHDDLRAAPTDDEAQHHIDGTGHDHAAQRRGKPPSLHAIDDRRNEREGRREKNGHLAACANLKNQRAHAGRKQGHVGAHARQDRHQHQRAECHEKHLRTEQGIFQPKRIRRIRLHLHSSEKNVCSLSSGGSRIPGLRGTAPLSRIGGSASPLPATAFRRCVPGVAEAGDDVAVLVEMGVDGGRINVHVGMRFLDALDAFGSAHEIEAEDALAAALLEEIRSWR